ncbi:uncharacterized protein TNCV_705851 [Trichonephila clavipes]|nr:uncharacterized protein TNCV_705851 [Trichonephila clavipes]
MALGGSLPQINLGVQGVTQGGHHSGAQRVNPEFRVGTNFRIIPEQYLLGVENVVEFLENMDNNLTYYEIPTQLACAYLKGHLTGRALDWFEVLGYRVVEDKATDYAHLKQALSEQFPVVRNRSELETRFYSSSQKHNQKLSDFVYDLLKIHKILRGHRGVNLGFFRIFEKNICCSSFSFEHFDTNHVIVLQKLRKIFEKFQTAI